MPQLIERFHLSTGMVEITYPSKMTGDDLTDFVDTAALLFGRLRRGIEAEPASSLTQTAAGLEAQATGESSSPGPSTVNPT